MIRSLETVGHFTLYCVRVLRELPAAIVQPRYVAAQMYVFLAGSAALAVVVGASMGLVTWMHLSDTLERYGSKSYLPKSLMFAVTMEVGPVSVGLLAASRLGAGLAAEFAAMNAAEQIDALRCIGVAPYRRLVAPRVLACMIVLPLLTVLVDYAALAGSFAAEWTGGSMSWPLYYRRAVEDLEVTQVLLATAKTVVFGALVGLIACFAGLFTHRSSEAVGAAATIAVACCTLAVLVSDVALVRLIQLVT